MTLTRASLCLRRFCPYLAPLAAPLRIPKKDSRITNLDRHGNASRLSPLYTASIDSYPGISSRCPPPPSPTFIPTKYSCLQRLFGSQRPTPSTPHSHPPRG